MSEEKKAIKPFTSSQIRRMIKNSYCLGTTFTILKKTGILNKEFARVFSTEQVRRAGRFSKCENCPGKIRLTVHHKIPLSTTLTHRTVLDEENLQVLCNKCHNKVEKGDSKKKTTPEIPEISKIKGGGIIKVIIPRFVFKSDLVELYVGAFKQGWGKRNSIDSRRYKIALTKEDEAHRTLKFAMKRIKKGGRE